MKIHERYIKRAIQLAKNALPHAMPNPAVGAVIVHKKCIIGEGYTNPYGGPHAEVNAINHAIKSRHNLPDNCFKNCTLYVTLEPCSHYGKTPPCADLIIRSGFKNVVIGTIDPFSKVAGTVIKKLEDAGINVTTNILVKECRDINKRFFTFHNKKRPYIILKWAQSNDGFIAPLLKESQAPIWISNTHSRQLTHKWRSEEQGILIGAQTALADNPSLTTREWHGKSPLRILIDTRGNIKDSLRIFNTEAKTIIINSQTPNEICETLFNYNIQSIIIEGGTKTLQAFIDSKLWDEARVFTAPKMLLSGINAPKRVNFDLINTQKIYSDTLDIFKNSIQ